MRRGAVQPLRAIEGTIHHAHMARQIRLELPGIPQHIVQRGNNGLPCFLDVEDRTRDLH